VIMTEKKSKARRWWDRISLVIEMVVFW